MDKIDLLKPLDEVLQELEVGTRLRNVLHDTHLRNFRDVCRLRRTAFQHYRNAGEKCVSELESLLKAHGLDFEMSEDRLALYQCTNESAKDIPVSDLWEHRRYEVVKDLFVKANGEANIDLLTRKANTLIRHLIEQDKIV